ncbi:hypothetical protein [Actinokineospora sp. HUAS TT18]|uniref:hypothetical protein n=1 Tax=Actinokineospora sp. HUAS TT18 TaxID=3447451 RepID=UPI003F52258E
MKLYADHPIRRARQLGADLVALVILLAAVWLATEVREQVLRLRAPGQGLVDAGNGLRGTFDSAADNADDVPLVGRQLADALHTGSAGGARLSEAGQWQIEAVESLAFWLTVALIAVPATLLLIVWLPRRVRYVREADAAVRLRDQGPAGQDLLALRALMTQPLSRLASAGPVGEGWRTGDPATVAGLATRELRRLGLHPPKR